MRRILIVIPLLTACEGRVRHLVCEDAEGNVVVDTVNLKESPKQDDSAWTWWEGTWWLDGSYHEISVPPHSCRYESYPKPDDPEWVMAECYPDCE